MNKYYIFYNSLMRLYRLDAFLITFLSYIAPGLLLEGLDYNGYLYALLTSGISVNFIYSYNSIADAEIDKINKPDRPMASGILSEKNAKTYVFILFLASVIWPFILCKDFYCALLSLIFPMIGVAYSNPFYPLKKRFILAVTATSALLVLPSVISLLHLGRFNDLYYISVFLFVYCFFVVPLKDIEDIAGDVLHGSQNWANKIGVKRLIFSSFYGLAILFVAVLLFRSRIPEFYYLLGFLGTSLCVEMFFLGRKKNFHKLYKALILSNILLGLVFIILVFSGVL